MQTDKWIEIQVGNWGEKSFRACNKNRNNNETANEREEEEQTHTLWIERRHKLHGHIRWTTKAHRGWLDCINLAKCIPVELCWNDILK